MGDNRLEQKLNLVRDFQGFAEERGLVFEYSAGASTVECYKRYSDVDKPTYMLYSAPKERLISRPLTTPFTKKEPARLELEHHRYEYGDVMDFFLFESHAYFNNSGVKLRPAHMKLEPCPLLWTVAHEGAHATIECRQHMNIISNMRLEESLADASAHILLNAYAESGRSALLTPDDAEDYSAKIKHVFDVIGAWISAFEKLYSEEPLKETRRTEMFEEITDELLRLPCLNKDSFCLDINGRLNNAMLVNMGCYQGHYEPLIRMHDACESYEDFLTEVSRLPSDDRGLEKILLGKA